MKTEFAPLASPEVTLTPGAALLKMSPEAPAEEHPARPRGIAIPEEVASEALALSSRYNLEIQAAYRRAAELQSRREALESARVNGSPGAMVELVGKYNEEDDNLSSMPKAGSLDKKFLRPKQAAQAFGVSESFIRHGIMVRRIPSYTLGGVRFVELGELSALIQKNRVPALPSEVV